MLLLGAESSVDFPFMFVFCLLGGERGESSTCSLRSVDGAEDEVEPVPINGVMVK